MHDRYTLKEIYFVYILLRHNIHVTIGFEDFALSDNFTAEVSASLIVVNEIELKPMPYNENEEFYSDPTLLNQVHCTSKYQRGKIGMFAHYSDGRVVDVSNETGIYNITIANESVITSHDNIISAWWYGSTNLTVKFLDQTLELNYTVSDEPSYIVRVEKSPTMENLMALQNVPEYPQIDIVFDDGTIFRDAARA